MTEQSKVERVARALFANDPVFKSEQFDHVSPRVRENFFSDARAAIAALSRPVTDAETVEQLDHEHFARLHHLQHDATPNLVKPKLGGSITAWAADEIAASRAALSAAPAPQVERGSDWFAGEVDCDGNELETIRADELRKLRDEREKFMWQVRDTCTRAEKAEAQVERMRSALEAISERCPATCDMTLAHEMADIARAALNDEERG